MKFLFIFQWNKFRCYINDYFLCFEIYDIIIFDLKFPTICNRVEYFLVFTLVCNINAFFWMKNQRKLFTKYILNRKSFRKFTKNLVYNFKTQLDSIRYSCLLSQAINVKLLTTSKWNKNLFFFLIFSWVKCWHRLPVRLTHFQCTFS